MSTRRTSGFTLLEIAVALAILGIGIVGVLRSFSASLRLEDRAAREDRVVLYARRMMDGLLAETEPECRGKTCQPTTPDGFRGCYEKHEAGPGDGVVLPDDGNVPDQILCVLRVDVTWQDAAGAKTYTLQSMRLATP